MNYERKQLYIFIVSHRDEDVVVYHVRMLQSTTSAPLILSACPSLCISLHLSVLLSVHLPSGHRLYCLQTSPPPPSLLIPLPFTGEQVQIRNWISASPILYSQQVSSRVSSSHLKDLRISCHISQNNSCGYLHPQLFFLRLSSLGADSIMLSSLQIKSLLPFTDTSLGVCRSSPGQP